MDDPDDRPRRSTEGWYETRLAWKKKTPSPCRLTQREAFEDWQALQERWKRHNQSMITKLLTIAYDASARA